MIIRVVCEGSTDFAVLDMVVRAVLKGSEPVISAVQPDFDAMRADRVARQEAHKARRDHIPTALGSGWTGIRSYLQRPAAAAVAALSDVFVVQVDADVRRASEIEKKLREPAPGEHELDPLCEHVKSWFAGGLPPSAVVVLPREATETWLLAAHTRLSDAEADPVPATTLMVKGLLGAKHGDPNKDATVYEALARPLADLVADKKQLARVPELARFVDKLRLRAHALRRAKKAPRPS